MIWRQRSHRATDKPARRALRAVALALCLGSAGVTPSPAGADVAQRWREALDRSDRRLQAGEWKPARKGLDRLLDQMKHRIESGPAAAGFLATAAALRAVAQAGLGNERDALWDWQMAVTLNSEYEGLDLAAYGEAGARLERLRRTPPPEILQVNALTWSQVDPPQKRRAPAPSYPLAKRFACLEEAIAIEAIVDRDGLPLGPRLKTRAYPVMGFAAMDVLRRWRFEPARYQGEAVAVRYDLTVTYSLPLCGVPGHVPPGAAGG